MKLMIFQGFVSGNKCQIIASPSKKEAMEALNISEALFDKHFEVTNDKADCKLACSSPNVIFDKVTTIDGNIESCDWTPVESNKHGVENMSGQHFYETPIVSYDYRKSGMVSLEALKESCDNMEKSLAQSKIIHAEGKANRLSATKELDRLANEMENALSKIK